MIGPLALAVLFAATVICTGAGVIAFFITLAHIGKTRVVLRQDKWQLVASILLAVIGTIILLFLLLGFPTQSWGQPGPPQGWTRATVSTCPPYNPSSCQSRTVWLEERSWCGRRASWWSPTTGREIVTVRCASQ
jgi:hypothetical protein